MLAIEVNFLTGRYVATAYNDRERGEWPPEPARLFSALVAAWAEAGEDSAEREALEWLEALAPPALTASAAAPRRVVSHFVPVNDSRIISGSYYDRRAERLDAFEDQFEDELVRSGGELTKKAEGLRAKMATEADVAGQVGKVGTTPVAAALELLPEARTKQERQFPSMTPEVPRVTFAWHDAEASDGAIETLDGLLARVTRLGHSASLVSCRLVDIPPAPSHVPHTGVEIIRCTAVGQLRALEQRFAGHQAVKPRALPFAAVRYGTVVNRDRDSEASMLPNTAGDFLIFELPDDKRRFPTTRTIELTEALRGATFHYADDPLPEGLSGHLPDGRPSLDPHVGFLALPNVGHAHADGRIMGLAVMLPEALGDEAARAAFRAIGKWEEAGPDRRCRLRLAGGVTIELRRKQPPFELRTLRSQTWERPSPEWVSVTPIALPKNPGRLASGSPASRSRAWAAAEEQVRQSCLHVGLPQPAAVAVSLDPLTTGAHPAARFPAFVQGTRRASGVRRRLVHAAVRFDENVTGPVVLGSGRFMGLGLMRPLPRRAADVSESEPGVEDER